MTRMYLSIITFIGPPTLDLLLKFQNSLIEIVCEKCGRMGAQHGDGYFCYMRPKFSHSNESERVLDSTP